LRRDRRPRERCAARATCRAPRVAHAATTARTRRPVPPMVVASHRPRSPRRYASRRWAARDVAPVRAVDRRGPASIADRPRRASHPRATRSDLRPSSARAVPRRTPNRVPYRRPNRALYRKEAGAPDRGRAEAPAPGSSPRARARRPAAPPSTRAARRTRPTRARATRCVPPTSIAAPASRRERTSSPRPRRRARLRRWALRAAAHGCVARDPPASDSPAVRASAARAPRDSAVAAARMHRARRRSTRRARAPPRLYYKSRTRSQRWVGIAPPRSPLHRDRATVHDVRSAVIAIACTLCTAHRKDKGVARELRLGCCRRTRRTRGERRRRRCGRVRRRSQRRLERR